MSNLACVPGSGKLAKAVPLLRRDAGEGKAKLGPDHPDTLQHEQPGLGYQAVGKLPRPCRSSKRRWGRRAKLGADHPARSRRYEQPGRGVPAR